MNPHKRHGAATDTEGELLIARSGYPITEKMRWRTPRWLFDNLNAEFRFDLDACAEDECALAPRWITAQEDALAVDWRYTFRTVVGGGPMTMNIEGDRSPIRTAFINPPWSARMVPEWVRARDPDRTWAPFPGTDLFLRKAQAMSRLGVTVVCLIPQAFDAEWCKPLVKMADEVRIGRRFKFVDVHGNPGPQPPGGHALFVYRPHAPDLGWPGGPRVDWDWNPKESR